MPTQADTSTTLPPEPPLPTAGGFYRVAPDNTLVLVQGTDQTPPDQQPETPAQE